MVTAVIGTDKYRNGNHNRKAKHLPQMNPVSWVEPIPLPSPPEYLMSAFGIVYRHYPSHVCRSQKLNVNKITVQVTHFKEKLKVYLPLRFRMMAKWKWIGKSVFLDIAKMCPVHKILNSPIQIETKLAIYWLTFLCEGHCKTYSNGEVTIVWQPTRAFIRICSRGLSEVLIRASALDYAWKFNLRKKSSPRLTNTLPDPGIK